MAGPNYICSRFPTSDQLICRIFSNVCSSQVLFTFAVGILLSTSCDVSDRIVFAQILLLCDVAMYVKLSAKSRCDVRNVSTRCECSNLVLETISNLSWLQLLLVCDNCRRILKSLFNTFFIQCCMSKNRLEGPQTCTKPALLHKMDKMMKKFSGPNHPMGRLNMIEEVAWAERRRNPVPIWDCDGCFRRFRGAPPKQPDPWEDELEEGVDAGDAGLVFKRCTGCDWTICDDCFHPENQGVYSIATAD